MNYIRWPRRRKRRKPVPARTPATYQNPIRCGILNGGKGGLPCTRSSLIRTDDVRSVFWPRPRGMLPRSFLRRPSWIPNGQRTPNRRSRSGTSISLSSATSTRTCVGPSGCRHRLETYRLPSVIRKEAPHLPTHVRPIFRDQTDIGAGPLLENLRKELEDSRFLIVFVRPSASQSEWVEQGSAELHPDGPGRPDHSVHCGGRAQRRRSRAKSVFLLPCAAANRRCSASAWKNSARRRRSSRSSPSCWG